MQPIHIPQQNPSRLNAVDILEVISVALGLITMVALVWGSPFLVELVR